MMQCSCGTTLGAKNKSGYCRSCVIKHLNSQSWFQERRRASQNQLDHNRTCRDCAKAIGAKNRTGLCLPCYNRDPEYRAKRGRGVSVQRRVKFATDPVYARKVREHGARLAKSGLGNAAAPAGSEPRKRAGAKISAIHRARLERIAERNRLASLTPFERQMEALKRGAALVEKAPIRSREYDFTLGGVSEL